jgi:hypothetical protein
MRRFILLLLLGFPLLISMTGCGSDNASNLSASTFAASEKCITCHKTTRAISSVTGGNITDEWSASIHNSMAGASCIDCHGSGNGHPSTCGGCHGGSTVVGLEFHNPDKAGRCYNCHGMNATRFPLGKGMKHFDVYTTIDVLGTKVPTATFVGTQNTYKCTGCHTPHNNTLHPQHQEWAESGHGEVAASPWIHYDFKTLSPCNRCHTTTGFSKYIKTGDSSPWATPSADKSREMLRCSGCHVDYSFKRIDARTAGLNGVTVPYGTFSSAILTYGKMADNTISTTYQDTGDSNICINCHSGLTAGRVIRNNPALLAKTAANSHYFAAAGTLYSALGYEYRTHSDYQLIYNGTLVFEHAELGMKNVTYRNHVINLGTTRGPCVACHMYDKHHTLKVITVDTNVAGLDPRGPRALINGTITDFPANTPVCSKCHTGGLALSFGTPKTDIRLLKTEYKDRLAELEAALAAKGIIYDPDKVPYFWPAGVDHNDRTKAYGYPGDNTKTPPVPAQAPWPNEGTLGAAFNLNLCFRDPGGFAHNHRYTERLIYDSLDFLDNGLLDESYVSAAFPLNYYQRADGTFYQTARPF